MPKPLPNYSSCFPWLFPFSTILSVIKLRSRYHFWLFSLIPFVLSLSSKLCFKMSLKSHPSFPFPSVSVGDPTILVLESCNCLTLPLTISSTLKSLNNTYVKDSQNPPDGLQSPIQCRLLCLSNLTSSSSLTPSSFTDFLAVLKHARQALGSSPSR